MKLQIQEKEPMSSSSPSSWSKLPKDLVVKISELLIIKNPYIDYVRFSLVCKSWYSCLPNNPYHKFPVLISPYILGRYDQYFHRYDECTQRNGIFGMAKDDNNNINATKHNKLYHLSDLPDQQFVLSNSIIEGSSSHGWLVMTTTSHEEPASCRYTSYLYNPFTNAKFHLPPISDPVRKVVLSSTPPPAAVVIAIFCNSLSDSQHADNLFFARPGDKAWTNFKVNRAHEGKKKYKFKDALFCGNKIYALQCCLKVCVFNMTQDLQIDTCPCSILEPPPDFDRYWPMPWVRWRSSDPRDMHLVGSPSDDAVLMIVLQEIKTEVVYYSSYGFPEPEGRRKTVGFKVFKWESETERWIRVKSLGEDQILFIGPVSSFCLSSSNTNGSHDDGFPGFRGNCICFIDYYCRHQTNIWSNYDKGIFSLEDERIDEFSSSSLPIQCGTSDKYYIPIPFSTPPAWLTYTHHSVPMANSVV